MILGGKERCKSQNLYSKKFLEEVEEKQNTEDREGNNNTTPRQITLPNCETFVARYERTSRRNSLRNVTVR